jgi:hypothetical protein
MENEHEVQNKKSDMRTRILGDYRKKNDLASFNYNKEESTDLFSIYMFLLNRKSLSSLLERLSRLNKIY